MKTCVEPGAWAPQKSQAAELVNIKETLSHLRTVGSSHEQGYTVNRSSSGCTGSWSPAGLLHRNFFSKGVVSNEDGEAVDTLDSL